MLHFTQNTVVQTLDGREKTWSIPELLENPEPLDGEPLAERNAAMRQVVDMAMDVYSDLSETARLRYDFWKLLKPERVATQQFEYTTKVTDTYQWQLTINAEGLFYKDISGEFDPTPGKVTEQLFSDFWFYGPCRPLPDLNTRKVLVAAIRNAFLQAGSPASYKHFTLFEYPSPAETLMHWSDGNEKASNFVIVRPYGIERGRKTWYDGLVYLKYLSFEQLLHLPEAFVDQDITPAIRGEIEQFLRPHTAPPPTVHDRPDEQLAPWSFDPGVDRPAEQRSRDRTAESKQLFMDNGGQTHYIFREGLGHRYSATPAEEAEWRKELLELCEKRIREEDTVAALAYFARTMDVNGATNVEALLLETAQTAGPKARFGLAQALGEVFNSDKAADILVALLDEDEAQWFDPVFTEFIRSRKNPGAQRFIIGCLQGDREQYFDKAVEVLRYWGIQGEEALTDRTLIKCLNWADATANDPDFRQALEKVTKIVFKK